MGRTAGAALAAGAWACAGSGHGADAAQVLIPGDAESFAVLELFTSEGCSSCPSADRQLDAEAGVHPQVVAMAWHVSYWDGLGWPDPYADPRFDDRQRRYAAALGSGTYTPQLVVQGQEQFTGQSGDRVASSTARWLALPGELSLSAVARLDGGSVHVEGIVADGAPPDAELQVVLVEGGLSVEVSRGENAGETLAHENVVRSWVTVGVGASDAELSVPADLVVPNARVFVFAQDPATMAVLGAVSVDLSLGGAAR